MSEKEKRELDPNSDHYEPDEGEELDALEDLNEFDEDDAVSEEKTPAKAAKKAAKPAADKKSKPADRKKSGNGLVRFFKDMRLELKKVAWPTAKQTTNNTGIVIAVVLVAGAFVWVFDGIAGNLIGALIKFFGA